MIRTVIINADIDTNPLLLEIIKEYAPSIDLVGIARTIEQGIKMIDLHKPDLIFLDLEIDDTSSFDMLDSLKIRLSK